jgi:hypothetical protein
MANLIVSFNQEMRNKLRMLQCLNVLLAIIFFGCGKVYHPNSIIITNFMQTLIPICWIVNVSSIHFGIEISSQKFRMVFRAFI